MKKLILISSLLISSFSFGADWALVTQSEDNESSYFVDKSYYKYDAKNKMVEIWVQTKEYKSPNSMEKFVSTKALAQYDCIGKRSKALASIKYNSDGYVLSSSSQPSKSFDIIFPDTIGESYWEAACKTKGNGLYLTNPPEFIGKKRFDTNIRSVNTPTE